MRTLTRTLPLVLGGLLLLGCGEADPEPVEPPADAPDEPGDPTDEPDGDDADLDARIEEAVADAAASRGVDADAVEVVVAEEVTWPDGALGCPEDDGMYTQALVDGYRIVVAIEGEEHHYHGALGQAPFPCDDPQPAVED